MDNYRNDYLVRLDPSADEKVNPSHPVRSFESVVRDSIPGGFPLMPYGLYRHIIGDFCKGLGRRQSITEELLSLPWTLLSGHSSAIDALQGHQLGDHPYIVGKVCTGDELAQPLIAFKDSIVTEVVILQSSVQELLSVQRRHIAPTSVELLRTFAIQVDPPDYADADRFHIYFHQVMFKQINRADLDMILRAKICEADSLPTQLVTMLLNHMMPTMLIPGLRSDTQIIDWSLIHKSDNGPRTNTSMDPASDWAK